MVCWNPSGNFNDGFTADQIKWEFSGTIKNKMPVSLEGLEADDM